MQRVHRRMRSACITQDDHSKVVVALLVRREGVSGQCGGSQRSGFCRFEDVDWSPGIKVLSEGPCAKTAPATRF